MFALRQFIENPEDYIPVPPEIRHRRTEVIFIALDEVEATANPSQTALTDSGIAEYFGCLPDFPDREPQGDYENRQTLA
jgi:hypothetical protein